MSILTVCDNYIDIFLLDQGPAKRLPIGGSVSGASTPMVESRTLEEGKSPDSPLAEQRERRRRLGPEVGPALKAKLRSALASAPATASAR